jgi:phytoene dehydrogenase-like protein
MITFQESGRKTDQEWLGSHPENGPDPGQPSHGRRKSPVGHISENGEQNWGELRDKARKHVFRRLRTLGISDIESHIKFEETYTPLSWREQYNLMKGSTHGLSHTLTQMAYFRPSNRHPRYQNLYFVGASTHPGTGVPTAMVSGRLVAERIKDERYG